MNYLSRVTSPTAFHNTAADFDNNIIISAMNKLGVDYDQAVEMQLRLPVKCGGWGLYSYQHLHYISYLSSLITTIQHDQLHIFTYDSFSVQQRNIVESLIKHINQQLIHINAQKDNKHIQIPASLESLLEHIHLHPNYGTYIYNTYKHFMLVNNIRIFRELISNNYYENITHRKASAWVNAIPTTRQSYIGDNTYRTAARMRMQLPPIRYMATFNYCSVCNTEIDNGLYHLLHCKKNTSTKYYTIQRHDTIKYLLNSYMHKIGLQSQVEPTDLSSESNSRPDIIFHNGDIETLIDVCIVDTSAPSYVHQHPTNVLNNRATSKTTNANSMLSSHTCMDTTRKQFIPFILSTHGGMQ
jgi:hypothetical protein